MSDTASVLGHHLQAFGIGLDELMKDYDDSSVLISPEGIQKGSAAIRGWFEKFIGGMPAGAMDTFQITSQHVVDDIAYISWKAEPAILLGTDTFVVKSGKIAVQTFAMQLAV